MRGWRRIIKPSWAPPESIAFLNDAFGFRSPLDGNVEITFGDKGVYWRFMKQRGWDFKEYPSCEIVECVLCRKLLRKAKTTFVHLCTPADYQDKYNEFYGLACIACVGRVNAIGRKLSEYWAIKSLIAKLERSRLNAAKNQNDRGPSRLSA